MFEFLKRIFAPTAATAQPGTRRLSELARRLELSESELAQVQISYREFHIAKRGGGTRTILAPDEPLKAVQRRILHRLLRGLRAHPCATGFERGHSIVTNALPHVGQDVVIRLDLRDFFQSTSATRVESYFRAIGWDAQAAALLARICTHDGSLPQGAPTSPRLSNLVNWRLDARLFALAQSAGAAYSRYADDITFSARVELVKRMRDLNPKTLLPVHTQTSRINDLIFATKRIVAEEGYELHTVKKLRIARRHDRQMVTGLVVNARPNLPRALRRKLRAIEHRQKNARQATMTPEQLAGWRALQDMIAAQSDESPN
jgi:retron-type reverse transcriptase